MNILHLLMRQHLSCRPFVPWTACAGCWNGDDPKRIVICEGCEVEYHTYCLNPPLDEVGNMSTPQAPAALLHARSVNVLLLQQLLLVTSIRSSTRQLMRNRVLLRLRTCWGCVPGPATHNYHHRR